VDAGHSCRRCVLGGLTSRNVKVGGDGVVDGGTEVRVGDLPPLLATEDISLGN
jgi:hypothetical protein